MPSPAWRTLGLALALLATTLAVCHGASDRQVLLSKEVQRESGDAVGVFQLREGDVLADAVAAFGRSVGLTPGEEASLLANVQQQAVSLRLVPLKSMDITLPGGRRITSLQIFEGDSVRDVVLGAADSQGVTEEPLREELVATVFKELKRDRIIPVLSLEVTVGDAGQVVSLQMFHGDEVEPVVAAFAEKHGLLPGQVASLTEQVLLRRRMHALDPLVELKIAGVDDALPPFKLYEKEVFDAAVAGYAATHGLSSEQAALVSRQAMRRGMQEGFLPYANVTITLPAAAGRPPVTHTLLARAKENVTEAVQKFAAEHELTQEVATAVLASAVKQGTEARILPALEFPVFTSDNQQQDQGIMFQLFQGDDANAMVAAFASAHGLAKDAEARLLEHTMNLAKSARLMPLVMLSVNVTEPAGADGAPGRTVPLSVPIYEGDAVGAQAEATARAAALPEDVVAGFVEAAVAEGRRARLEPAIVFNVTLGSEELKVAAYMGDNVTEVGMRFAQARSLTEQDTSDLLGQMTLVAMRERLLPMISVPVSVTLNDDDTGAQNTTKYVMEVYHGENIEGAVDKFLRSVAVGEEEFAESRRLLLEKATRQAYDLGLLPLLEVPVKIAGKDLAVKVFKGDTQLQSVERFLAGLPAGTLPESWSDKDKDTLIQLVDAEARERRLLPVMQLEVQAGDQLIPLYLFKGDNITAMMENMKAKLNLSPEDSAILEQQVVSKAQARRLVPKLTVPVQLESGETDNLLLFEGDSVRQTVAAWGKAHSLPDDQITQLESGVKARATMERVVPALRFAMDVEGTRQELLLYSGDNISAVVEAFVTKHAMGGAARAELVAMVTDKALDARLMPEHAVPVEIEGKEGEAGATINLLLFRGDDVEAEALRFADDHKLRVERANFVASVKQAVAHRSAPKDEL